MTFLDVQAITCATKGCVTPILTTTQHEAQLRRSGASFYCPTGHSNFFPKPPPQPDPKDVEIANLRRRVEYLAARQHDPWRCPACGSHGYKRPTTEDHRRRLLAHHQRHNCPRRLKA